MLGIFTSRIVVTSGGPSSASEPRAPKNTRGADHGERRAGQEVTATLSGLHPSLRSAVPTRAPAGPHAFSSRLSSLRKRQSVPSAMIAFGLAWRMPGSYPVSKTTARCRKPARTSVWPSTAFGQSIVAAFR
jgi:hypothetical protein